MKPGVGSKALMTLLAVGGLLGCMIALWARSEFAGLHAQEQQALQYVQTNANASLQATTSALQQLLDEILLQESATPFYQYNNLYADPLSSAKDSVTPSPLARGPQSALVLAHFQVNAKGEVTMPTINPSEPSLSNSALASAHQVIAKDIAGHLTAIELPAPAISAAATSDGPRRASVTAKAAPVRAPAPTVMPTPTEAAASDPVTEQAQHISNSYIGPEAMAQRSIEATQRQGLQRRDNSPTNHAVPTNNEAVRVATQQAIEIPAENLGKTENATEIYLQQAKRQAPSTAPKTITVIVDPFEWMSLPLADGPTLVAVRSVHAPTGGLRQGFLINRVAIDAFLGGQPYQPALVSDVNIAPETLALRQGFSMRGMTPSLGQWGLVIADLPELIDIRTAYAARQTSLAMQTTAVAILALAASLLAGFFVWQSERLAAQRSRFAATAAHELRTPLASLQLHGELLAHGLGDPKKSAVYAQRMADEASRLGRVVTNVLDYAQLEKKTLSAAPRLGDVALATSLIVERHRPMLAQTGMALHWDDSPPVQACFDRDALDRVLTNLLDNAEKYSRATAARAVWVSLANDEAHVFINVRDNGPGMPAKLARRVFHPFSRGDKNGPAGLGLGLALSRTLCRGMGGELTLASGANRDGRAGTAFVIRLKRSS